jgi:light-regulated signal transduction histidine kinase (bacteriophytochrome)
LQSTGESGNTRPDHDRAAREATISVDPASGRILSADPAVEAMLGIEPGTLAGRHISHLCSKTAPEDTGDQIARFISEAAHDLVAPLNQASALAGLLLHKNRSNLSPDAAQLIKQIESAAARMTAVAQGVRKYLALADSRCDLKPVDMNDILTAAITGLSRRIEDAGARVNCEPLPPVMGDPSLLITLCSALLDNAIKFAREAIPPVVQVTAGKAQGNCWFSIGDNGIGIAPERQRELFRPFKKLHGQEYPGLGLGLATAKKIVDRHAGSIWIEAGAAEGTILCFTLPAAQD